MLSNEGVFGLCGKVDAGLLSVWGCRCPNQPLSEGLFIEKNGSTSSHRAPLSAYPLYETNKGRIAMLHRGWSRERQESGAGLRRID